MLPTIGIDASPLVRTHYTGTEWFAYNLIQALTTLKESEGYTFILYAPFIKPEMLILPKNFHWKILNWPLGRFWISIRFSFELLTHKKNLLFIPANNLPLYTPSKVLTIIHDIGFIKIPSLYSNKQIRSLKRGIRLIEKKQVTVITISNSVKRNIIEHNKKLGEKSTVVHLSINKEILERLSGRSKRNIPEDYLLYIGTLNKKKNASQLIDLYDMLVKNGFKKKLVIIGNKGYGYEEIISRINSSENKQNIITRDWVTEEEYVRWLTFADGLIIPSLHEGFSLPILEAQFLNIPLILNDIPVHREVSGEAALFIRVNELIESTKKVIDFYKDTTLRHEMVKNGFLNQQKFTLDETARDILKVCKNIFD